jgi:hypothetical protein
MAKQERVIHTTAAIRIGGRLVDVDTLTEAQRVYVATRLSHALLGEIFAGRLAFGLPDTLPADAVFADLK